MIAQADTPVRLSNVTFALAQAHFIVGDVSANVEKMASLAEQARDAGANVIIYPELAMVGFAPEDILLRPQLSDAIQSGLERLSRIEGIVMLVGYPHIDQHGTFNSYAILHEGNQRGFYHKQTLPKFVGFDEYRYFSKGRNHVLFDFSGLTIGLLLGAEAQITSSMQALKDQGADIVIIGAASAFEHDSYNKISNALSQQAQTHKLPLVYVNGVGGQDDLVFDGGSMAIQADGTIAVSAHRFLEQLTYAKFAVESNKFISQKTPPTILSEPASCYQALVVGLRDYVHYSGFSGVIIGLSGGIDAALTLCIAVDALGANNVYAVMMPYKYTPQNSLEDAQTQARRLGVSFTVCPIHDAVDGMIHTLTPLFASDNSASCKITESHLSQINIETRARGTVLMALSNKYEHLVLTTGNKSELAIGSSILYGDMAGGFAVLKDVYKTKVFALAHYRNQLESQPIIPERIFHRSSSHDDFPEGISDQKTLDTILHHYIEEQLSAKDIIEKGYSETLVLRILKLVDNHEYKRQQFAIGTKVSRQTFGRERRYPSVNHWRD